jgi:DNA-directed RNA polymerase specialized sigma24 family protein
MRLESEEFGSITKAIIDLGHDDRAAEIIWRRFFDRLCEYTQKRIGQRHRRHFDEDDVANSAFFVLFEGIKDGRFAELQNRDDLWQLLTLIASRKACNARKHFDRLKRGGGKVQGGVTLESFADAPLVEYLARIEPPQYELLEQLSDDLVQRLPDPTLRRVAMLRLAGHSNAEIAAELDCVTRTVERKLQLIRMIWTRESDDDIIHPWSP